MISPTDATTIDSRDAYPIDECVAKMLGWMQGSERLEKIKVDERGILPDMLPHIYRLVYTLDEHLDQLKERARLELFDAADAFADALDGTPEKDARSDIIDQKYIAINDCAKLIMKAHFYKSEIRKELAKGEQSQLKIDHVKKDGDGVDIIFIKLDSLDDWAKKYSVNIIDVPDSISGITHESKKQLINEIKPWMIPEQDDPDPEQPWYIPARYFARQLVKDDSTLLTKKDLLAEKVAQSLKSVGIYKRGGKLPHNPGTVKKSFSNVNFG